MEIGNNINNKIINSLNKLHIVLSQDGPIDSINQKSRSKIFQLTYTTISTTMRNIPNTILWN